MCCPIRATLASIGAATERHATFDRRRGEELEIRAQTLAADRLLRRDRGHADKEEDGDRDVFHEWNDTIRLQAPSCQLKPEFILHVRDGFNSGMIRQGRGVRQCSARNASPSLRQRPQRPLTS